LKLKVGEAEQSSDRSCLVAWHHKTLLEAPLTDGDTSITGGIIMSLH